MGFVALGILLGFAYLIEWLDDRRIAKETERVAQIHRQMYDLIDEYYCGREARERKAQTDAMISAFFKDNGKEYRPRGIRQVTTTSERNERVKAELRGTADNDTALFKARALDALDMEAFDANKGADHWYYGNHTQEEKREHLIQYYIKSGFPREQAERNADGFFRVV